MRHKSTPEAICRNPNSATDSSVPRLVTSAVPPSGPTMKPKLVAMLMIATAEPYLIVWSPQPTRHNNPTQPRVSCYALHHHSHHNLRVQASPLGHLCHQWHRRRIHKCQPKASTGKHGHYNGQAHNSRKVAVRFSGYQSAHAIVQMVSAQLSRQQPQGAATTLLTTW